MGITAPASTHVAGDPNFPPDADNAWAALAALISGRADNTAYGTLDPNGITDCAAAINNALGYGDVLLPPGTFYINSTLTPTLAGSRIKGSGTGLTTLVLGKTGQAFSGTTGIQLPTAGYCRVSDLTIAGPSSSTASNPQVGAISGGTGRFCQVQNVFFEYVNGWCVEDIGTAANVGYATMVKDCSGLNNAGGVHIKGVSGSSWGAQAFLHSLNFQQTGVGSGTAANLDVFRFEDCFDITATNFNTAVSDASSGSSINIMGNCSALYFTVMDLGAFPNTYTESNATILLQDGVNGSPHNVIFNTGIAQAGLYGIRVTGGAYHLDFANFRLNNNYGHGLSVEGTGQDINFHGIRCAANGLANSFSASFGTFYDINWPSTGSTGSLTNITLSSPVAATTSVTNPANFAAGNNATARNWLCNGTGTTASNVFPSGAASPMITKDISPWNPRGSLTVTVPASGTPTGVSSSDRYFWVLPSGSGSCTITVSGGASGGPGVVLPASTASTLPVPFFVPANQTIKWTGTAPTWQVYGN